MRGVWCVCLSVVACRDEAAVLWCVCVTAGLRKGSYRALTIVRLNMRMRMRRGLAVCSMLG